MNCLCRYEAQEKGPLKYINSAANVNDCVLLTPSTKPERQDSEASLHRDDCLGFATASVPIVLFSGGDAEDGSYILDVMLTHRQDIQ